MNWDGKDGYGRAVQGTAQATVDVYYDYVPQYYAARSDFEASFARAEATGASVTANRAAGVITQARTWTRQLGAWDARGLGLNSRPASAPAAPRRSPS